MAPRGIQVDQSSSGIAPKWASDLGDAIAKFLGKRYNTNSKRAAKELAVLNQLKAENKISPGMFAYKQAKWIKYGERAGIDRGKLLRDVAILGGIVAAGVGVYALKKRYEQRRGTPKTIDGKMFWLMGVHKDRRLADWDANAARFYGYNARIDESAGVFEVWVNRKGEENTANIQAIQKYEKYNEIGE